MRKRDTRNPAYAAMSKCGQSMEHIHGLCSRNWNLERNIIVLPSDNGGAGGVTFQLSLRGK